MKIGLCGLGDRLGYLADVFRQTVPEFDFVAYADPAPAGVRRMDAEQFRRMRGYADLETMLDRESLDLVMIGSPNAFHCDHLTTALRAGMKIFCEKPVVVSEDETFRLLRELRGHGTDQVIVGLVLRYAPLYVDLTRMAGDGTLGDIVSIEASEHIPPAHGAFFFRDWRRKSALSGGFLLEKCCHDLDLYAGLLKSRPRRVVSFGGNSVFAQRHKGWNNESVYHRWPSYWESTDSAFSGDADIVDHQVALIEYENGAKLCFHTNVHTPDHFRRFCVIGSQGMAEGDFVRGYLKAHRAISGERVFDASYEDDGLSQHYGADGKMAKDLARHLREGAPLPVSVTDALEAGLTAMKIDESRASGQIVDLTDLWERLDALAA